MAQGLMSLKTNSQYVKAQRVHFLMGADCFLMIFIMAKYNNFRTDFSIGKNLLLLIIFISCQ